MKGRPLHGASGDGATTGQDDEASGESTPRRKQAGQEQTGDEQPGQWRTAPLRLAWPAYVCAVALLVYAADKGFYAAQGKLGLPGNPTVPAAAYRDLPHAAMRQWTLSALGLGGALLALASVRPFGRHIPRWVILVGLWGALVPMAAGGPYVLHNVVTSDSSLAGKFISGGRPIAQAGAWLAMAWSYQIRSRVLRWNGWPFR